MTRSIGGPRRATVLLAGAAVSGTLLLSGCGAGQIAATANMEPTISGVNVQLDTPDGSYKIQDLAVAYRNTEGYPRDGQAPLEATIYNDTPQPVTVRVGTSSAGSVVLAGTAATGSPSPGLIPSAPASATPTAEASTSPEPSQSGSATPGTQPSASGSAGPGMPPSASATPTEPAPASPASITIPAGGFVILTQESGSYLQLVGLSADLPPGEAVELVFEFNGRQLRTKAPVAIPLTPAPRATPVVPQEHGAAGGHGG